jgi:hypothetical protein
MFTEMMVRIRQWWRATPPYDGRLVVLGGGAPDTFAMLPQAARPAGSLAPAPVRRGVWHVVSRRPARPAVDMTVLRQLARHLDPNLTPQRTSVHAPTEITA